MSTSKTVFLIAAALLLSMPAQMKSQDRRERIYLYPVLQPQHAPKPKVEGWALSRVRENLNRGVIALRAGENSVYVGWRLLQSDPENVGFNVYRSVEGGTPEKLNERVLNKTTDFLDMDPADDKLSEYWVCTVIGNKEMKPSERVPLAGNREKPSLHSVIPFQGDYVPQRIAIADLNGDGTYDYVIKQPSMGIDPAHGPDTTGLTYKIEAYLSDGTFLWQRDLGPGIEPGIWYSPMIAYDFDGDGKAEVAAKTGPEDAREGSGRVLSGPEWCSVFNGMTGEEIDRVDWPERSSRYGDYNRNSRNQMGMAYLDGNTPALLVARGTYKLMVLDAYHLRNGKLEQLWHWDGDEENPVIRSMGSHGMHSADVDEDGREEVILGSVVIDDDGTALYSTGLGHPDKVFVTDIDPARPGLELFFAIEPWRDDGKGVCMVDAKTGRILWEIGHKTFHVGDGMVADIDPSLPGLECFATEDPKGGSRDKYMFSAAGERIGTAEDVPGCRDWVFWDTDLLRETFAYNRPSRGRRMTREEWMNWIPEMSIVKYKGDTVTSGIEGRLLIMADILGDWREEVITVTRGKMYIYTTTIPAGDRRVCLMQDPVYRAEVAHRAMGYEQSPVTGYYMGMDPDEAPEHNPVIPRHSTEN
ncbi:MAG: silent information regulator protein Sir2 [Bacteroidales bacterium]|nr:silent information regulator protein Sir2 [Bacteroidales bacterium]MBN2698499.1 silent information regulator protein Sir2 [Bacteroidales bacterium]